MIVLSTIGIFFVILVFLLIGLLVFYIIISNIHKQFIYEHSKAIKRINEINDKYIFKDVEFLTFYEEFDNEMYYNKLSPKDLLVYDLIENMRHVKYNISSTIYNSNLFDYYIDDIRSINKIGEYDTFKLPILKFLLLRKEENIFRKHIKKPIVNYEIKVTIVLTNINKAPLENMSEIFDIEEIEEVISQIEDKTNNRYNNRAIWDSICKIERAKVTNRLRFAIYKRDGNRCCKCGRSGVYNDLEIDHIMPISKGGKTHPNNLQTLCKRCNKAKSDTIEPGTKVFNSSTHKFCPLCGAPLKIVNGKNGKFYGCMNYPKYKFTKKV